MTRYFPQPLLPLVLAGCTLTGCTTVSTDARPPAYYETAASYSEAPSSPLFSGDAAVLSDEAIGRILAVNVNIEVQFAHLQFTAQAKFIDRSDSLSRRGRRSRRSWLRLSCGDRCRRGLRLVTCRQFRASPRDSLFEARRRRCFRLDGRGGVGGFGQLRHLRLRLWA